MTLTKGTLRENGTSLETPLAHIDQNAIAQFDGIIQT